MNGGYHGLLGRRNNSKKELFHQDNARAHTCAVSVAKIVELKFELYSPYLTPSGLFSISQLETITRREKLRSNEEIVAETRAYFEDLPKIYHCMS